MSAFARRLRVELAFVRSLVSFNLAGAMEYRAAFISQVVGMFVNDGIYLVFWLIFFDRFGAVRGYELGDVLLLYGLVAFSYGLAHSIAGNNGALLATAIAQGRLDYYLVLPRALLPHILCSRMSQAAVGDLFFGPLALVLSGWLTPGNALLFALSGALAALIFVAYGVITGSLAFFFGNAQFVSAQLSGAQITFAIYPNTLFSGGVRFILYTLLPAAFVGAVPLQIVRGERTLLLLLAAGVLIFWSVALLVFYRGLRRYESGSALNVNV